MVTGSRDWTDWRAMVRLLEPHETALLIHGGARGLDNLADRYAKHRHWDVIEIAADWDGLGKAAGSIRNGVMVRTLCKYRDAGYPCFAYAFPLPQSRGTVDCMKRLEASGFTVVQP